MTFHWIVVQKVSLRTVNKLCGLESRLYLKYEEIVALNPQKCLFANFVHHFLANYSIHMTSPLFQGHVRFKMVT